MLRTNTETLDPLFCSSQWVYIKPHCIAPLLGSLVGVSGTMVEPSPLWLSEAGLLPYSSLVSVSASKLHTGTPKGAGFLVLCFESEQNLAREKKLMQLFLNLEISHLCWMQLRAQCARAKSKNKNVLPLTHSPQSFTSAWFHCRFRWRYHRGPKSLKGALKH